MAKDAEVKPGRSFKQKQLMVQTTPGVKSKHYNGYRGDADASQPEHGSIIALSILFPKSILPNSLEALNKLRNLFLDCTISVQRTGKSITGLSQVLSHLSAIQ